MQSAEVKKTGGQVDELCLALVDAANDSHPSVKEVIIMSLHEIGKRQPEMVLSSIKGYLIKHQKLNTGHRVVLLQAASRVLKDSLEKLPLELAKQMVKLASSELTRTKDVEPDWQTAASEVLVALGTKFDHEVMAEMLEKLAPGSLPHYFIVQTLASFATANAFGVVPFLKDILGRMLPMMGLAKQENMRWVFANCLGRFSESIMYYVANAENAPYQDITVDRFYGEIYSSYDILFNIWLNSKEPKVRIAVVDAIGHMTHIMSREKLEEQLPKLLPGVTSLYRKHAEHYLITQGLCSVLDAACADGSTILTPHLEHLLSGLHSMACNMPDFSNPVTVKNHNELLRCFSVLITTFTDRVVGFLLNKLESNNEKVRIGTLAIVRHLVNSSGSYLENKEELLITGVQIVLTDNNLKVKRMLAQAVTAMAHHGYLELQGGHKLVEFIVRQCALQEIEEEKPRRPVDPDGVTPNALRAMCENILHLLTTTVSIMEPVLWPFLLECVVPEPFTNAVGPLCRSVNHLAAKKRGEEAADFMIDFDVQTNVPRPAALIARLLVMAGYPFEGRGRGVHVLRLMKSLSPILHPDLVDIWDTVIPKLTQYLEDNTDDKEKWNQKSWEDLVLKLLSKSLDEVDADEWVCAVGQEMGNQIQLYTNCPKEKNFSYKCIGVVLRKAINKDFVQGQLNLMFSTVKHSSQTEREGCAIGVGFCAGSHLDLVLTKLEQVAKNQMVRKSTGLLGFMKDKTDADVERIKSTVMLCYGYAVLYAPPSLITSRLETNVFRVIISHFKNVKDAHVKQNLIRAVELIGKALEPSRLQQPEFSFTRRKELLDHMLNYMKAEPPSSITTEIRPLAMDACASLAKLNPRMTDAEVFDVVKTSLECVYTIQPTVGKPTVPAKHKQDGDEDKDSIALINQSLESLNQLLKEGLLRDPVPNMLHDICKHIEQPWLLSIQDHERYRAIHTISFVLNTFHDNMLVTVGGKPMVFESLGSLLARLVPRCTDPLIKVRQTAIDCVQRVLRISLRYEGFAVDSKDDLVDALSTLKHRASEDDATILFSVASDLSKVLAKRIPSEQLSSFVSTLQEGLTDIQNHSSSGACVVLNSTIRIRGHELKKEVNAILSSVHDKLTGITHAQTRTGTLRSMRTLCSHHLIPFITTMLDFPLPYDQHVVEIWRTLAGDPNLALSIFDYLLDLVTRSLPYQEKPNPKRKKETIKVATVPPAAITCGLTEMFRAEETTELVLEHFHRLFPTVLLRMGTCVGLHPPEPPQTKKKEKEKAPNIYPLNYAVECMKELLVRCQYDKLKDCIESEEGWKKFEDEKTYPDGITVVARALCAVAPQHVPKVVNHLNPSMSSAYDAQRIVVAALFAELINQRCGGNLDLVEVLMNSLLGRLVDSSHLVRKYCIRGLGNISTAGDAQIEKYSTTILSAMMAGMDDKDDIEDEITLESMSGLAKILAKLDENNVRQILINICLRIRPCFEKDQAAVRAAAFTVFGKLSRFGDGPSKVPFLEQIHTNFISVLLHMNEEPEVTKACKGALRLIGPLLGSTAVNDMFQKHLLEEGHLHYGEFMNDLSRLIIADFPGKMSFYVMGCVSFFKSSRDDIKANSAMFVGFLLGNLPLDKRDEISKDHVCGALILLLKDPSAKVRSKSAEAMSLLYDY